MAAQRSAAWLAGVAAAKHGAGQKNPYQYGTQQGADWDVAYHITRRKIEEAA